MALRLTEAEALRIAAAASGWGDVTRPLAVQGVEWIGGEAVWLVRSSTVGSGVTINVADATGEAEVRHWGLR